MLVKIKSCQIYSKCYRWYAHLIGRTVKVKKHEGLNRDYIIDDERIKTTGTIYDCAISPDDVEVITEEFC